MAGLRAFFMERKKMLAIKQPKVLAQLDGENAKETIELVLRRTEKGSTALEVRSLRWGQGIGWYTQKTIVLDPSQLRRLASLLRRTALTDRTRTGGRKILTFPT